MFGRWRVSERRTPQFSWKMQARWKELEGRMEGWKVETPEQFAKWGKMRRQAKRRKSRGND